VDEHIAEPEPPLDERVEELAMRKAMQIVRMFLADAQAVGNARLTLDTLSLACGLSNYSGESMSTIARKHGISRAAVSKRCVDMIESLGLPPSRAMRQAAHRRKRPRQKLRRVA